MVTVRGPNTLPVDVRSELEEFLWASATWTSDKLIAASPFRHERHPSFAVILEHGGWRDYGATDPRWQSGSFIRLLSFLRQETCEETEDYLAVKYGARPPDPTAEITLSPIRLVSDKPRIVRIGNELLDGYNFRSPYLAGRGISESVQQLMRVGYDRQRRAITIPWLNADGSLGNVKYRKVADKTFWYYRGEAGKGGRPIREMLYGINVAYERRIKRAAIVEAEIDALTLMSHGIFAVATGGTAFTSAKADLLLRSPIEEITIFRDNDGPGRAWRNAIVSELYGKMDVRLAAVPRRYGKDVNEAVRNGWNPEEVKTKAVEMRRMISFNIG